MEEIIGNIHRTLAEDLSYTLQKDSRLCIATCCFSIYAYEVV